MRASHDASNLTPNPFPLWEGEPEYEASRVRRGTGMLCRRSAGDAGDDVGQLGNPVTLAVVRLVHQDYPEYRECDVDQGQDEIEQRSQSVRQHCDEDAEDDGDCEPRD